MLNLGSRQVSNLLKATYTKDGRCHKNGVDYFQKEKFEHSAVKKKISDVFGKVPHKKILVVWDVKDDSVIPCAAKDPYNIEIWKIQELLQKFGKYVSGSRDDVLRIMELVSLSQKEGRASSKKKSVNRI